MISRIDRDRYFLLPLRLVFWLAVNKSIAGLNERLEICCHTSRICSLANNRADQIWVIMYSYYYIRVVYYVNEPFLQVGMIKRWVIYMEVMIIKTFIFDSDYVLTRAWSIARIKSNVDLKKSTSWALTMFKSTNNKDKTPAFWTKISIILYCYEKKIA